MTDTRPVRTSENLDWERLADYLRRELASLDIAGFDPDAQLEVEQFSGGRSNLTYLLRFGRVEMVLRRPPFGPVPPRAHDMARECRVLAAVNPHFPLAPRPYLLCEDPSIIGSIFYVMERRRGLVIQSDEPIEITNHPELRRMISGTIVDTLCDLHSIDVVSTNLESLGKPVGFVARQIRGWTERWQGSKTSELPEMDALALWLEARIPPDPARASIVHGDYKLDNLMLDQTAPERVVSVFDWEMSAIGDPLVDVGLLLVYWVHLAAAQDEVLSTVTARPGWYGREEILERYASRSGRNLDGIALYEVFALFKIAVVVQQIYARFVRGQTDDPRFASLGTRVASLARMATDHIEKM